MTEMKTLKSNWFAATLVAVFALLMNQQVLAQVKVGENPTTIDSQALLELETTATDAKAFVPPRVAAAEMVNMATSNTGFPPPYGAAVYCTDCDTTTYQGEGLYCYKANKVSDPAGAPNPGWELCAYNLTSTGGGAGAGAGCDATMVSARSTLTYTHKAAVNRCSTLPDGGFSDWSLPTMPCLVNLCASGHGDCTGTELLWTSTPNGVDYAWITLRPSDDDWDSNLHTDSRRVRCVR